MKYVVRTESLLKVVGDVLVLPCFSSTPSIRETLQEVDAAFQGKLLVHLERHAFKAHKGEWLMVPTFDVLKTQFLLVVGLGEKSLCDLDTVRFVAAITAQRSREVKAREVVTCLPLLTGKEVAPRLIAEAWVTGFGSASYQFHRYKSAKKETEKSDKAVVGVERVTLCESTRLRATAIQRGCDAANHVVEALCLARDLVNTPPGDMTPQDLLKAAQLVAKDQSRIELKLLTVEDMRKLGMDGTLAVARGSQHEAVGVHLTYHPKTKPKKRIAVIGKAVTFDSGGLSLKPADAMMTMKCDMAGAAAVIGLFQALPTSQVNVEVHGIFLAVENMPSGSAYRPGDVVKAMNGTTIEVLNTDAEGRVTLADALSYAATLKPDAMIDLATLTGACVVALGDDLSALMTNNPRLGGQLLRAAREMGEGLWELPLLGSYEDLIKSKVADIKNIGGRSAGAITAGLFLQHFVEKIPWAHLDIAGPAFVERETRPDHPYGGSGTGVRLLLRFLQEL